MNPARWQQIEELFHAALACDPQQRSEFLASKCAGDEPLQREIESLLSSLESADGFIETPAGDVAAELLGTQHSSFEPGQQIENYRIVRKLGSGGMGEVYLAEDVTLKRKVALKLLPPHFTVNPDRVRRFEREARAASALNHPNIVTIYEIRQSTATHFIATEFVDGRTLRQLIDQKPFKLTAILNVGIQVADALCGAHAAGIVHRDIKPENIMIHRQGYVKVLDFGLAKLSEQQNVDPDLETPTLLQSNPGLVMGTVQYMSPEQARGKHVGQPSDIWSLGVVLYELLAGQAPFVGETSSHVMVSLMEDEPQPLKNRAVVPDELDRIVMKALRKNQHERYQTADQISRDLKALKQKLQLDPRWSDLLKKIPSREPVANVVASGAAPLPAANETAAIPALRSTASVESRASEISSFRRVFVSAAVAVVILGALLFGLYRAKWRQRDLKPAQKAFQTVNLIKVTNAGKVRDSVISADGKYVAYVAEEKGKAGLRVREVETDNDRELTSPTEDEYYGLTFSPDGRHVYYTVKQHNNSIAVLYGVTVAQGSPFKLIVDVDGPVSFSPDGKQIVFVRGSTTGERVLIVANADGSGERKIASRTGFRTFSFGGPAWSPDGKIVACGASYADASGQYMTVVGVKLDDGTVNVLAKGKWLIVGRVWWVNNGEGLVFSGTDLEHRSTSQLWMLSYPGGESRRITSDLQDYDGVSLTADSATLVTRERHALVRLWIAPNGDAASARQILTSVDDQYQGYYTRSRFSWMPDGRIIYTSEVNGTPTLWTVASDGSGHKQLTRGPGSSTFPAVSSDSRHIIFVSDRSGLTNIWRMDIDGTNERQLTFGEDDSWAWCSPDAQWIVYHSGDQGKRTIRRIPITGGDPEQLTDYTSLFPVVSPDGQWISAYYRAAPKAPWQIVIIPFDGGPPVKTFELPREVVFQSLLRWTPDGKSIAFIVERDGVSNIWTRPVDGGPPEQLTNFQSDQILWFDWSPDGQQLAVSRGTITSDIVMIQNRPQP